MGDSARKRLAALVILVVVAVPLLVLVASGSDDSAPKPKPQAQPGTGLRIERGSSGSDLVIYVKPAVNVLARAGGRRQVQLKCVDAGGSVVMAQDEAWPFAQTDGGQFEPHAHMVLDPIGASAVERCLVAGTKPVLEGRVP
jgi:hypothetical protein